MVRKKNALQLYRRDLRLSAPQREIYFHYTVLPHTYFIFSSITYIHVHIYICMYMYINNDRWRCCKYYFMGVDRDARTRCRAVFPKRQLTRSMPSSWLLSKLVREVIYIMPGHASIDISTYSRRLAGTIVNMNK